MPPFLDNTESVEKRVERRVERQHKDGHAHADLARNRNVERCQHSQKANGEPAQEVGHGDGNETSGDGQVSGGRLGGIGHCDAVDSDGVIDERLASGDQQKQHGVQNDDHPEGISEALEVPSCDWQRDTNTGLLVEFPVRHSKSQRKSP